MSTCDRVSGGTSPPGRRQVGRPRGYVDPGKPLGALGALGALGLAAPAPPPAPVPAPAPAPASETPSTCLKLEGLIKPEMLSDEEYPELLDDIRGECEQSGKVRRVAWRHAACTAQPHAC